MRLTDPQDSVSSAFLKTAYNSYLPHKLWSRSLLDSILHSIFYQSLNKKQKQKLKITSS